MFFTDLFSLDGRSTISLLLERTTWSPQNQSSSSWTAFWRQRFTDFLFRGSCPDFCRLPTHWGFIPQSSTSSRTILQSIVGPILPRCLTDISFHLSARIVVGSDHSQEWYNNNSKVTVDQWWYTNVILRKMAVVWRLSSQRWKGLLQLQVKSWVLGSHWILLLLVPS